MRYTLSRRHSRRGARLLRFVGLVTLLLAPGVLLARGLLAHSTSVGMTGIEGAVALTVATAAVLERDRLASTSLTLRDLRDMRTVGAVIIGAVSAHALGVHAGFGPVLGSAVVGLLAGVGTRAVTPASDVDSAVYCGSFVGMASTALFPSVVYVLLAGFVAGTAYSATERVFDGYGGKLGTLAFFGCATTAALTTATYPAGQALPLTSVTTVVPVAAAAAVVTAVVNVRLDLGGVVSSALVGLVAGLTLPLLLGGGTLVMVAFCASFVGMSTPERLADLRYFAAAGAVAGIVFVAVASVFPGAGGKLGTVAFVSCLSIVGADRLPALAARSVGPCARC